MTEKKRIVWVDYIKFFCIFFVILSHLSGNSEAPELRQFYTNFFLTGFLFASGYTFRFTPGFKNHLIKKVKQLLIPWLLFCVLNTTLSQVLTFNPERHDNYFTEMGKNLLQVRGYGDGVWFLSALFVAYLFLYFFVKAFEKRKERTENKADIIFVCISIALFFLNTTYSSLVPAEIFPWETNGLPWHLEYVPYAICFMFAGYLFRNGYENEYENAYDQKITLKSCIILTVIYFVLVYLPMVLSLDMPWYIANPYSFIKSFLSLVILIYLCKHIRSNRFMLFVGQNTLVYFGLHGKVLSAFETGLKKILPSLFEFVYSNHFSATLYSIVVAIFVSVILIVPTMIINKYVPFLAGKPYRRANKITDNSSNDLNR